MTWDVRTLPLTPGAELDRCQAFVAGCDAGHFQQAPWWVQVGGEDASRATLVMAEKDGRIGLTALLTLARVGGLGPAVAHVERGPVMADTGALRAALPALKARAREQGAASLRLSPYLPREETTVAEILAEAGFKPARTPFGYDRTLEADLALEDQDLLRSYRKGHRAAVRQAQRAGVSIRPGDARGAETFTAFYEDMVSRKGATPRSPGLFRRLEQVCARHPESGFLLMAHLGERCLGGVFVLRTGQRAIYAFGASPASEPGLPRTHILQFEAMRRARDMGCLVYDMGGFSAGTGADGSRTPRQNVNVFKKGFARRQLDLMPVYETILRPLRHTLVETGRRILGGR